MALFTVDSETKSTNSKKLISKSLIIKVFFGLCPKCSFRSVFRKYIILLDKCPNCGLKINADIVGDGGSWFSMLITSIIVGFGALILEINFHPQLWLHIVIWPPTILLLSIIILRPFKALFLCLSHKNKDY